MKSIISTIIYFQNDQNVMATSVKERNGHDPQINVKWTLKTLNFYPKMKKIYNATRLLHHFIHHSFWSTDVCHLRAFASKAIRCATELKSKQIDEKRGRRKKNTNTRIYLFACTHKITTILFGQIKVTVGIYDRTTATGYSRLFMA